jgi:hypothetical protein
MRIFTVLLLAPVALGACAYGFEDDNARFACDTDDDCSGDDVCAGFTLVDNSAESFCIDRDAATAAIGIRVPNTPLRDCQVFGPRAGSTWNTTLTLVDSDGQTTRQTFDPEASPTCESAESARLGGSRVCCIGGPDEEESLDGRASVLCFFAPEDVVDVEMELAYVYGGGTGAGSARSDTERVPTGGDAPLIWVQRDITGAPSACPE